MQGNTCMKSEISYSFAEGGQPSVALCQDKQLCLKSYHSAFACVLDPGGNMI